jgi:hypothetical protein
MTPRQIFKVLWKRTKDLELSINCSLVLGKIRNSFLFQHEGYTEYNGMLEKVIEIINGFGCFRLIKIDQGILIMNKETKLSFDKDNYTNKELGIFLGYPCAGDIDDNRNYSFHINADYGKYHDNIYSMICGNKDNENIYNLFDNIKEFVLKINKHVKITCEMSKIHDYTMKDELMALKILQKQYNSKKKVHNVNIKKSLKKSILQTLTNGDCAFVVELHNDNEKNHFFEIDLFDKKYIEYTLSLMLMIEADEYYNILQNIPDEETFGKICTIISKQKALHQKNYLENVYHLDLSEEYAKYIKQFDKNDNDDEERLALLNQ